MNRYPIIGLVAAVVAVGATRDCSFARDVDGVRTTAYTHTEADHIEHGRQTAAGGTLKYGKNYSSAAADWSKYPLGTKFKIDGMDTVFVVDDYGRALVGTETIDIYKPSRSAMNDWGVRNVDIKIIEEGDFEKSREILAQRTQFAHVRKMLTSINQEKKEEGGFKSLFKSKSKTSSPPPMPASKPEIRPEPAMQLASATPPPSPKPAPEPAPKPAPPVVKSPEPPKPEPAPAPVIAASAPVVEKPTLAPAPVVAEQPSAPVAPKPTVIEPAVRKVRPLTGELVVALSSTPAIAEPTAASSETEGGLRKRSFRPLGVGIGG